MSRLHLSVFALNVHLVCSVALQRTALRGRVGRQNLKDGGASVSVVANPLSFVSRARVEIVFAAGYGSFCAWMLVAFQATGLPSESISGEAAFMFLQIVFGITLVVTGALGSRVEPMLGKETFRTLVATILAIASLLWGFRTGAETAAGHMVAALPMGICAGLFLQVWAKAYRDLPTKSIVISNAMSYLFNSSLIAILGMLGDLSQMALMVVGPLVSVFLLQAGSRLADPAARRSQAARFEASSESSALVFHAPDHRFLAFIVGSFLIFSCTEFARYIFQRTAEISSFVEDGSRLILVLAAVMLAGVAMLFKLRDGFKIEYLYRISFITLIVSTLLIPYASYPKAGWETLVGYSFSLVSYQYFNILNFTTTIVVGKKRGCIAKATGIAQASWVVSCITGTAVASAVMGSDNVLTFAELSASATVVTILLAVSFLFVLTERTQIHMMRTPVSADARSTERICGQISKMRGLSQRESEILLLLAKGHNTQHISEELFISKNTVNTHRYHIYKKLEVGSQQDVISLVEKMKSSVHSTSENA